ncbi:WhiB family transcriptional regulator [Embleya sp. NPDC005971]|uniref:WhiB family transcriptional regulator n=1 Tax=Embleya sp. NPDC005971 TaxID=3156724 RepID=UPI0033DF5235
MTTKTCTKCGKTKPTSDFNRNAYQRDGLRSSCRLCQRTDGIGMGPMKPKPKAAPKQPKPRGPLRITDTQEWAMHAACRFMKPALFEGTGSVHPDAAAACDRCPVRLICLEEELQLNPAIASQSGYRGGMGPAERVALLKERKAAADAAKKAAESVSA